MLGEITSEHIAAFAAKVRSHGLKGETLQTSSVNSRLRVLRRLFRLAIEWGELDRSPKVTLESGENHREYVLPQTDEARYLAAGSPLLADVATVLVDSGQRPEELFRQEWQNITWVNGRHGTIFVACGKTKAARRIIPMTPRVRAVLESRWDAAGKPQEGWIWPAEIRSGHIEPSTLKMQHRAALKASKVRPFVLYSLRHTFLTRLGESGCDVWTLARIAGHSNITMSMRYVHMSEGRALDAMTTMGGHKTGHYEKGDALEVVALLPQLSEKIMA